MQVHVFLFIERSEKSDKDYFQSFKDDNTKKFAFEKKNYLHAQLAENLSFAVARFSKQFT